LGEGIQRGTNFLMGSPVSVLIAECDGTVKLIGAAIVVKKSAESSD
jgi:hypothetical protein